MKLPEVAADREMILQFKYAFVFKRQKNQITSIKCVHDLGF
jgi:hypothetical protein